MVGSYAYLSLVLNENETATSKDNIIPFTDAVNTPDIYLGFVSGENLYGYITLSTPGHYMVQYMVQIGNTNNFAMVPIVGSNGSLPKSGITGADFSAYLYESNNTYVFDGQTYGYYTMNNKSNQIVGSTIQYFDTNQTLSLYQVYPTTFIDFTNNSNNAVTMAYMLVYLLPSSSWGCFINTSIVNPPVIPSVSYVNIQASNINTQEPNKSFIVYETYQGNYNSIGSGIPMPQSLTNSLIPFSNYSTSTLSTSDDFSYNDGNIKYAGETTIFLILFMANLAGYATSASGFGAFKEPGTFENVDSNYDSLGLLSNNFGIQISSNTNNTYISGVINTLSILGTIAIPNGFSLDFVNTNIYSTYQNFQYLSSELVKLNENDSFSFNFSYYSNSTVLQNQMYGTIPGTNARSFMFPVTNPYIYLTGVSTSTPTSSNNVISNGEIFSFTSYTNNETFIYDLRTNNILLSKPSNIIVYFSITVKNSQVPFISLNADSYSNVYSNNYYPYNGNTYPVTGMAIFQNVSNVNLTNVSGYDIYLALPYNDTITVLNAALFIMTI